MPHHTPPQNNAKRSSPRIQHVKVLYNELDQWRDAETARIKQADVGERRKLALRELLHKETRLLQTIDRLKITAAHEGKVRVRCRMTQVEDSSKVSIGVPSIYVVRHKYGWVVWCLCVASRDTFFPRESGLFIVTAVVILCEPGLLLQ